MNYERVFMKKNMVYIQSGGPTTVINSSLYGAIREAQRHPDEIGLIFGSLHGIEGLINDDLIILNEEDDKEIELLKQTSGAILGSTRMKLPKDYHDSVYYQITENIKKHNIGYIFINGGNDSMDTCHRISELCDELGLDVHVIGVPKTIDNDLAVTDHSLGFGSAAKYVINCVAQISIDARCFRKGKVHIVEIMGRSAGWLTASTDLLDDDVRPDLIYIPEIKFTIPQFLEDVRKIYAKKGSVIIALSEGVDFPRACYSGPVDAFGHAQLEGVADELAEHVKEKLKLPIRVIELSVPQRAFAPTMSKIDQEEAIKTGEEAVKAALKGEKGKMVVLHRLSNSPYKIEYEIEDVGLIANAVRMIPDRFIADQTRMDPEFKEYIEPLIQGEVDIAYEKGIVKFTHFKKIKA